MSPTKRKALAQRKRARIQPQPNARAGSSTAVPLQPVFLQGQLVYAANVTIENRDYLTQVDTGSADFWLASTSCRTRPCRSSEGYDIPRFDTSSAYDTGAGFSINYYAASASGPIVTTNVSLGALTSTAQAFGSADNVQGEPLSDMGISGILGLALPANSVIQDGLVADDDVNANNTITDPRATGSILPGIWTGATGSARSFGLGLQRLPSDGGTGKSTLTIGGVDPNYVANTSSIHYTPVVPDPDGIARKWKTFLTDLVVIVNGTQAQIPLRTGGGVPTVILDSGAPFNYGNVQLLNALYGAWRVGPAADGSGTYYVDCQLEMHIAMQIAGQTYTMHPLDANLLQSSDTSTGQVSTGCVGAFQALPQSDSPPPADLILGAPFMRSVYTVYSCDSPVNQAANAPAPGPCDRPQIGFRGAIDSAASFAQAQNQFNIVRVQHQPLGNDQAVLGKPGVTPSKGLGSGAKIAIGVVCGIVGISLAMGLMLLLLKRRRARNAEAAAALQEKEEEEAAAARAKLSAKEKAQARELALLQGDFAEYDALNDEQNVEPRSLTAPPGEDWDVSSKGYWEARAIKNEYLQKHGGSLKESTAASGSARGASVGSMPRSEEYELSDTNSAARLNRDNKDE